MKLENISEEFDIYGMLMSLSNRIQTIGDKELKGVTLKQDFLLIALEMFDHNPSLREVGDLIGCSYQNVKRMAVNLEKSGYIRIVNDETDRRKLLLIMTEKVEELNKSNQDATIAFMKQLYHDISKEDMKNALAVLMKMDRNIGGIIE